jgi:glycosyltransferase involved in cell wall biosynthesis
MATYNGERYLREQVASIQAQTFGNWRLLVADDGSRDGTVELVRELAAADQRIVLLEDATLGRGACARFFWLLDQARTQAERADYLLFCDQDDVWLPQKVEHLLEAVQQLEAAQGARLPTLAFCDAEVVDDELKQIAPSFVAYEHFDPYALELRQLLVCNNAPGCTMLFNRALADAVKTPRDLSYVIMHDWWVMLVAAALGSIAYVDEPLVRYRQHGNNTLGAVSYDVLRYLAKAQDVARAHLRNQRQAGAFGVVYEAELSPADSQLCRAYATMRPNGLQPVATIARYRLWQPGIERRIGQVVLRLFMRVSL